ncbi:MAG: type II secretion system F family protein [Actinomycetota bacterium]
MSKFFGSDIALLLILAASFLAVFFVTTFLMGSRARARRDKKLAQRLGGRTQATPEGDPAATSQFMPDAIAQAGNRFAVATGFSVRLDDRLEQAGMPIAAGEFVALTVVSALVGAVVASIFLLNIVFILMIAGLAGLIPYMWLLRSQRKRRNLMLEQLADTMSILASSLRAGYSFLQALDTVSKEIGEPSMGEFQRVVAEIRLGRPIEDALIALGERVDSDDLRWAVIAINVQRQVGGNLAEVLDIVASTVRERAYIRRQVQVLSAEGRISVAILAAIPFALLLYISIVNSEYIKPLFTTTPGLILLIGGGVFVGMGIFIMSRMIKIDV